MRQPWPFVALLLAGAPLRSEASIINGDFESGLTAWSTQGAVGIVSIPPPIASNFAHISGAGRLWQVFTLPAQALELSFDFFAITSNNPGDSGPPLNDTFAASLVDDATFTSIIPPVMGAEGIPAFLAWPEYEGFSIVNTDYVHITPPDTQAGIVGRVSVNLQSLPQPLPTLLRLELSVANGNDARRLDVYLDNVQITIPSPSVLTLLAAAPVCLLHRARR